MIGRINDDPACMGYCNFHDIRLTWIADVSLLVNESRSYDLCSDLTVFNCMVAVDLLKAVYFEDTFIFFF